MRRFVMSINYIEGFEFTKTVVNGTYRCSFEITVYSLTVPIARQPTISALNPFAHWGFVIQT